MTVVRVTAVVGTVSMIGVVQTSVFVRAPVQTNVTQKALVKTTD